MREAEEHAALVELFRHYPDLAAKLAAQFGDVTLPAGYTSRVGDPVQRPATLAADVVIEIRDADDVVQLAIVVEIQRKIDEDKKFSWPSYLWLERSRRHCETCVLVIATRKEVADWARLPIVNGPNSVHVIVLGPGDVPWIVDLDDACANPALAVLSATMHAREPGGRQVVRAAMVAVKTLPAAETRQYSHLVFRALDADDILAILEDIMQEQEHHGNDDAEKDKLLDRWDACVEILWMRHLAQQVARAEALVAASDRLIRRIHGILLGQLERRGIAVDADTRARVLACEDVDQLDEWLDRVVVATRAADVFDA
jgi:hypothetical protein